MFFEIRFTSDLAAGLAPGNVSVVTPVLFMRVRNVTRAYAAAMEEQRVIWTLSESDEIVAATNPEAYMTVVRREDSLLGISRDRRGAVKFSDISSGDQWCIIVKQCSRLRDPDCRWDATVISRGLFMALERCKANIPLKFPYTILPVTPSPSLLAPTLSPTSRIPSTSPSVHTPSFAPTYRVPSSSPTSSPRKSLPTATPSSSPGKYTGSPSSSPSLAPSFSPSLAPIQSQSWNISASPSPFFTRSPTLVFSGQGENPVSNNGSPQAVAGNQALWALWVLFAIVIVAGFAIFTLKIRKKSYPGTAL